MVTAVGTLLTPFKVGAATFLVAGGLLWWAAAEPVRDYTVWVWLKGGALRTLTLTPRFTAVRSGNNWSIEWPVINNVESPIYIRARVTHCNNGIRLTDATCPFGQLQNGSCETPAKKVDPGGWGGPGDRLSFSGPMTSCLASPFEHPINWALRRHRWTFEFDVSQEDGRSTTLDPELQIDGHNFAMHTLKAALLGALAGGLVYAVRRLLARQA